MAERPADLTRTATYTLFNERDEQVFQHKHTHPVTTPAQLREARRGALGQQVTYAPENCEPGEELIKVLEFYVSSGLARPTSYVEAVWSSGERLSAVKFHTDSRERVKWKVGNIGDDNFDMKGLKTTARLPSRAPLDVR